MANYNSKPNLTPVKDKKKLSAMGKVGGKKSGEVRRTNRTFKEIATAMLTSGLTDREKETLSKMFPNIDVDMLTRKAAILSMQVNNAMKGDLKAAQWLQEVAGEKDAQKVEVNSTSRVVDMSKLSTEQLEAIASIPIPEDEKE